MKRLGGVTAVHLGKQPSLTNGFSFNFAAYVEAWSSSQIARWIKGLGLNISPSVVKASSGAHLLLLDKDELGLAIPELGKRNAVAQGIALLNYFCYEAAGENLEMLCARLAVACLHAARQLNAAQAARQMATKRAQVVSFINELCASVSHLAEQAKKVIFWLDRSPFDTIEEYVELRNKVCELTAEIVDLSSAQPKVVFPRTLYIAEKANELRGECLAVIRECDDPLILSTAYLEKAQLKRSDDSVPWGLNLQSSYRGVHVVNEVKLGSPADLCGRIDAGDELVIIEYDTVVGWDLSSVVNSLATKSLTLTVLVRKRPRDSVALSTRTNRPSPKPLKLAPGSRATAEEEEPSPRGLLGATFAPFAAGAAALARRRSSTFVQNVADRLAKRRSRNSSRRRASVSCSTAPLSPTGNTPDSPMHYDLLGVEHQPTHVVRRTRTMRTQPNGYTRSFIDNKLLRDGTDDDEQLTFNVPCPSEFAEITTATAAELAKFGFPTDPPKASEGEWAAPISSGRLRPYRAPAESSGLSTLSHESPRPQCWDEGSAQSPSAWSLRSSGSPLCVVSHADLNVVAAEGSKDLEGWVRRRKTSEELHAATNNKWPKCWMTLSGSHLYIREQQHSKKPTIIFCLSECIVSSAQTLKTSKKYVFSISRGTFIFYFSCYSQQDLKAWMRKLMTASRLSCERAECAAGMAGRTPPGGCSSLGISVMTASFSRQGLLDPHSASVTPGELPTPATPPDTPASGGPCGLLSPSSHTAPTSLSSIPAGGTTLKGSTD